MPTTLPYMCHCVLVNQADFHIPHHMCSDAEKRQFPVAQQYRKNTGGKKEAVFVHRKENMHEDKNPFSQNRYSEDILKYLLFPSTYKNLNGSALSRHPTYYFLLPLPFKHEFSPSDPSSARKTSPWGSWEPQPHPWILSVYWLSNGKKLFTAPSCSIAEHCSMSL